MNRWLLTAFSSSQLSRRPGNAFEPGSRCFFVLYLWPLCIYGLRPLTSWRVAHTRPRGNQLLFPLGTPSRHIKIIWKAIISRRGWIQLLTSFWCSSALFENANASDGTSCTAKASLTSCQAHAIFFNGLKFRVEFRYFQAVTSSFLEISELEH